MVQKKLPNNFETDDLLSILSVETQDDFKEHLNLKDNDVLGFVNSLKIKQGTKLVHQTLLYRIYKELKGSLDKKTFNSNLSLYIPKQNEYYLLNKEPSELVVLDLKTKRHKTRPKQKNTLTHLNAFLNSFEVKKGKEWVDFFVIDFFYNKWLFNNKKRKLLTSNNLALMLKLLFETKHTKAGYVFKLQHNFDAQTIENIKESWKRKKTSDHK